MAAPIVTVDAHHAHAVIDDLGANLAGINLTHGAQCVIFATVEIGAMARFPAKIAARLNAHCNIGQHVPDILVVNDWISASTGVCLAPVQRVLVGGPCGRHRGNASHRTGPGECLADDKIALAHGEHVLGRYTHIVKADVGVLIQALAHLVDDRLIGDTRCAARDQNTGQSILAFLGTFGAHDNRVQVRPLHVPTRCAGRPILAAVDDVLAVP